LPAATWARQDRELELSLECVGRNGRYQRMCERLTDAATLAAMLLIILGISGPKHSSRFVEWMLIFSTMLEVCVYTP
jgi:hypothetical protein